MRRTAAKVDKPEMRGETQDNSVRSMRASPQEWGRASGVEMSKAKDAQKRRKQLYAAFINQMKLERGKCMDCGLRVTIETVVCFDWDHRNPELKSFGIADARTHQRAGGIDTIANEIAKCDLVCSNCHRLRTYREKHYLGINKYVNEQPTLFDPQDL